VLDGSYVIDLGVVQSEWAPHGSTALDEPTNASGLPPLVELLLYMRVVSGLPPASVALGPAVDQDPPS
jgi:hypothetical protein